MTVPNLKATPWMRDTLPNMLWICSVIATNDELRGMHLAMNTLDVVDEALAELIQDEPVAKRPVIDGQLTSLELVSEDARSTILERLQSLGLYDLVVPEKFANALGMYPNAPGRWLIMPWISNGLSIDWEAAQRYLTKVIETSAHGQDRVPTRAKFIVLARYAKAGRIVLAHEGAEDTIDLLARYPGELSADEMRRADPTIRAMFLAFANAFDDAEGEGKAVEWARKFWRTNWHIYPCSTDDAYPGAPSNPENVAESRAHFVQKVRELHQQFLETARKADPDLYEPDRYEVLTGITLRALRLAHATASSPVLWSGEHGSPMIRSLIEALIVFRWLVKRDDASLYYGFKEYGRGHLKLLKLHLEDYLDSLGEPDEDLQEYLNYLDAEVNQDVGEEWQNISIQSTFGGVSARDMAIDVGMEQEYRLLFAPASSATHGEWYSLDRYVLQRCHNVLHGGHRIPRSALSTPIGPQLIDSCLSIIGDLVSAYIDSMKERMLGGTQNVEAQPVDVIEIHSN